MRAGAAFTEHYSEPPNKTGPALLRNPQVPRLGDDDDDDDGDEEEGVWRQAAADRATRSLTLHAKAAGRSGGAAAFPLTVPPTRVSGALRYCEWQKAERRQTPPPRSLRDRRGHLHPGRHQQLASPWTLAANRLM